MDANKNNVSVYRGRENGHNVVCLWSCPEMVVGKIKAIFKTAFPPQLSFLILQFSPPHLLKGLEPEEELESESEVTQQCLTP